MEWKKVEKKSIKLIKQLIMSFPKFCDASNCISFKLKFYLVTSFNLKSDFIWISLSFH